MERTLAATREARRATKEEYGGERRGWRILTCVAGLEGALAAAREARRATRGEHGEEGRGGRTLTCVEGLERALVAARETRRAAKGEHGVDREKRWEVSYMRGRGMGLGKGTHGVDGGSVLG